MVRPPTTTIVPFVSMPYITQEGRGGPPQPGFFGGLLGRGRDPLFVLRDPNAADFAMPELSLSPDVTPRRMDERRRLMDQLAGDRATDLSGFQAKAFDLLTSPATQRAFQVDREPAKVRDAYGRNIYGQSVLLARRLIEAGVRFVTANAVSNPQTTLACFQIWDTHRDHFRLYSDTLLPELDQSLSALLTDLDERGLLAETLVIVMGEFGRTPRINTGQPGIPVPGRDHWGNAISVMVAGGGLKGGVVVGSTNDKAERPKDRPLKPGDLLATVYHQLGIDPTLTFKDHTGRPHPILDEGKPIDELL